MVFIIECVLVLVVSSVKVKKFLGGGNIEWVGVYFLYFVR